MARLDSRRVAQEISEFHGRRKGWLRRRDAGRQRALVKISRSAGGRSNLGSTRSSGAILAITLPVVGAAFQPEVVKPWVSGVACGSSSMTAKKYRGGSAGRIAKNGLKNLGLG